MKIKIIWPFIFIILFLVSLIIINQNKTISNINITETKCSIGEFGRDIAYYHNGKLILDLTMNCCTNLVFDKIYNETLYLKETGELCRCFCRREFVIEKVKVKKVIISLIGGKKIEINIE